MQNFTVRKTPELDTKTLKRRNQWVRKKTRISGFLNQADDICLMTHLQKKSFLGEKFSSFCDAIPHIVLAHLEVNFAQLISKFS